MGLFDWLTGKRDKVEIGDYQIWLTQQAKFAGVRSAVAAAVADPAGPSAVIVVAHFNDCLQQLRTAVAEFDGGHVFVARADDLTGRMPTDLVADEKHSILIIVSEQHPLVSHDDRILAFASSFSCRCRLVHHVSLEDALMKRFAGQWVENVSRQLGMKEDEVIQSRMVVRRIRSASKKIAKRATGDLPAESAEEWLARNCP